MPVGGLCSTAGHNQKLPLHLAAISALLQGQGASTKWLCSPPRPGYTPATLPLPLPRLGFSHSKTSRAWARIPGGYGKAGTDFIPCDYVTPWLQTLELSTRCFPSYHQQLKREAGDWKNPEVPYGTKRQAGRDPPCGHPPRHPIPPVLRGDPALCTWEYFGGIKSQICTQPTLMGLTRRVVHVLPVEVVIAYREVLSPQQRNTATPLLYAHQGR